MVLTWKWLRGEWWLLTLAGTLDISKLSDSNSWRVMTLQRAWWWTHHMLHHCFAVVKSCRCHGWGRGGNCGVFFFATLAWHLNTSGQWDGWQNEWNEPWLSLRFVFMTYCLFLPHPESPLHFSFPNFCHWGNINRPDLTLVVAKAWKLSGLHLHAREVNMADGGEHACEEGESAG